MLAVFQNIINLILPPRCLKCGVVLLDSDGLCADCFNEINFISQPYCKKCGMPFGQGEINKEKLCGQCIREKKPVFKMSRSAFIYDEKSKDLILGFKFFDKTENSIVFARWMKNSGKDIFDSGVDVIIPIPLHYKRLIKRRYNQSGLLAKELSKITNCPVDYDCVTRHKSTRPQVEFLGEARVRNVKNAFVAKYPDRIKGKRILLVDDVMTTGSTLKECALVLKKAGAHSICSLTVART